MNQDLIAEVTGMSPDVANQLDPEEALFTPPTFEFEVVSKLKIPGVEKMNGKVVLRYPNLSDDLRIESLTRALGANDVARMTATLLTCIEKAPASWYELKPNAKLPTLNLGRLLDDSVLADVYLAFNEWQRTFR